MQRHFHGYSVGTTQRKERRGARKARSFSRRMQDKKGILTMDDKTLYNQQVERLRQKEAECFLTFLDRYSTLLKLARENNFSGEDCYRVVEAFLRMDSTE